MRMSLQSVLNPVQLWPVLKTPTPKVLDIGGNEPAILFLDLTVAISVYVAFLSRYLIRLCHLLSLS
jgi:hypothetical protein